MVTSSNFFTFSYSSFSSSSSCSSTSSSFSTSSSGGPKSGGPNEESMRYLIEGVGGKLSGKEESDRLPRPQKHEGSALFLTVPVELPFIIKGTPEQGKPRIFKDQTVIIDKSKVSGKENKPLDTGVERRKIKAELAGIENQLTQSGWKDAGWEDPMTADLLKWKKRFSESLSDSFAKTRDVAQIRKDFVEQLQQLLCDPICLAPLDDDTVLGSDGRTYGSMSLSLYRHLTEEPYKQRSPFDKNNSSRLTTTPHQNVQYMIQWLKEQKAELPHQLRQQAEEVKNNYKRLILEKAQAYRQALDVEDCKDQKDEKSEENSRESPDLQESIRYVLAIQQKRDEGDDEDDNFKCELEETKLKEARENYQREKENYQRELEETTQWFSLLDPFKKMDEERERFDERISSEMRSSHLDFEAQMERLHALMKRSEDELAKIQKENQELQKEIQEVRIGADQVRLDTLILNQAIKQTEEDVKKRKNNWVKDLATAVAITGACIFASWAVASALAMSGVGVQVAVIPSIGAGTVKAVASKFF